MAERVNHFKMLAQALGITDPAEIREYIRQEQRIETENLLKEREMTKRLEIEQQRLQSEKDEREKQLQIKLQIESDKIKAELVLAEKRLQIKIEDRDKKLQLEKIEIERKAELEKIERQEKLRIEAEKAAEESKRIIIQTQLDNEFRHTEAQREFELKRLEAESRNNFQQQLSNRESETQIRIAEIQASASNTNMSNNSQINPNLSCKQIRDLPPLKSADREQIENYLCHFERLCKLHQISADKYCLYLASKLSGDLLNILTRLNEEEVKNYELFRENVNRKYLLNGDYFRGKFYALNLESGESNAEFVRKLSEIFEKWLKAERVGKTYEDLFSFFVAQQYYRKLPIEKAIFLKEHDQDPAIRTHFKSGGHL